MAILKKYISISLCLVIIVSAFAGIISLPVSAGTEATGKRDLEYGITYWYSDTGVSGYTSGSGTENDPYIITTAAELRHLARGDANSAGKYYKLGNDIVINDTASDNWYEGTDLKNWIKGTDNTNGVFTDTRNYREMGGDLFRGHFDGGGYTISGLYIDYNGTGRMSGFNNSRVYCGWGLFPLVYGATFKNVQLKDVYIKSNITASSTNDYHGYGALVGIVHGEQPTTFSNVQVENVQYDITRPNLASAGKPVGMGGIMGYSYGNLTVTDAIVKNVSANIKNWYATSRSPGYIGAIVGATGWGKTVNLTNVLTIGKMNPLSAVSESSGGAVSIQSGNWIADTKTNLATNVVATNCYAIGAEKILTDANITKVADDVTFIANNLDTFYTNIGSSTNWANKVPGELPQLADYYIDNSLPSDKRDLDFDGTYWYSNKKVSSYTYGTGTENDPYIITTAAQLRHLARGSADSAGKYYKLGNDIVINDTTNDNWYEGTGLKNWIMGTDDINGVFSDTRNYREMGGDLFRGHFDGGGYTISGLYIDYNGTGRMSGFNNSRVYCGWGLFPLVYGATFENVKLKDVYIKSNITASSTTDYHGYGALVGNVHGDQSTTFTNVQVENVHFDIARPNLASAGKPVGIGGIMGYSYGDLNVTDAVVKNVTANIKNYYATSRCVSYVGGIVGAVGWGKTITLTNVFTIGKMNPLSASSASSGGAVTIASGNWIADVKTNSSVNVVATNCYAIGAEKILSDATITKVADEAAFLSDNLDAFYNNIGTSNNWTDKVAGRFPQLESFALDNIMAVLPTNEIIYVKYQSGKKLVDVAVEADGYSDDGKWYDDYDCTIVSADEYPERGKIYYRKWSKFIKLDFEKEYFYASNSYPAYPDPHDPNFSDAKYHVRSDVKRVTERNGNKVLQLTYSNDNPVYTAAGFNYGPNGEYFHNYKNSPYIWIFDTSTNTAFSGSPGFKYTISFDYEIEGPLPKEDVSFYLYLTKDTVSSHDAAVNGLKNSNNILAGKFDVNVAEGSKGRVGVEFEAVMGYVPRIVMVTNDGNRLEEDPQVYHSAYIDNLTVEEKIPAGKTAVSVAFDSDGGSFVAGFRVLKNNQIGKLPVPTKSGYLFDCWYLADDANMVEINTSYTVTKNIKLKAKWVEVTKSNYDSEGFEEFDNLRYPNVIKDYNDLDTSTLNNTGIVDSTMTAANRYIEDYCPDGMGAALLISNSPAVMSNGTGLPATVLLNKDGTKFSVKSGTIYKIEFDYLPLGESSAHSYIGIKYGSYALDSLNGATSVGTEKVAVHGLKSEKTTVTQYFKASTNGFVYFTLGARQNFDSANSQHFVLIDNVKITVTDDAKSITYVDANTNKPVDSRPVGFGYYLQYGMPGDKIREFAINTQAGKQIAGFYEDRECTILAKDYDVIGDKDKIVYVKMKNADYSKVSNFDNPIVLDFESSKGLDLEAFYRYMPYMSWTSTELDNIVDYIGDDSENAFEGSGYVRIKDYEAAYGLNGHSFVLYDKNNPSGIMILEPNTTFRITAQAKYEDDAQIPSLKIWSVDPTNFSYTRLSTTITSKNVDMMGYDEISSVITTGETPVAIAIGAVYLAEQNVYIDNVKVEKLLECTIKFETNGGDPIDSISVFPYSELITYDPGFAFKPGYEFVGWYLDKEFTKPFDFLTDYVTKDVVLYAKYIVEELSEDDSEDNIITDDVVDDYEESGPEFGEQWIINDTDTAGKTDAIEKIVEVENGISTWIVVVIIVVGVLVLGGIAILVIWLIKRKRA